MFKNIQEYILLSQQERQRHLQLNESCIEIGGYDSREFRGLLAHFLKTTIPTRVKVVLCHACHNHHCSNPRHMYWGTYSENEMDARRNGKKTGWKYLVEKYGEEKARKFASERASKAGKMGGGSNKLTKDQIKERQDIILECRPREYGWVGRAARRLNISHTQVRRFVDKHMLS